MKDEDGRITAVPCSRFNVQGKANSAGRLHVLTILKTCSPMGKPMGRNPEQEPAAKVGERVEGSN